MPSMQSEESIMDRYDVLGWALFLALTIYAGYGILFFFEGLRNEQNTPQAAAVAAHRESHRGLNLWESRQLSMVCQQPQTQTQQEGTNGR